MCTTKYRIVREGIHVDGLMKPEAIMTSHLNYCCLSREKQKPTINYEQEYGGYFYSTPLTSI